MALDNLVQEAPGCGAVSLVVSWFGTDLRCGECRVTPRVEQSARDGQEMPWRVSGIGRPEAGVVSSVDGRPGFGGTPADAAVVQAIAALKARGQAVMFYPFLLMDIRAGNGLPDPWSGAVDQPVVPWRGRITASVAPGRAGTPDQTAACGDEVAAFFGTARPEDFTVSGTDVAYNGPGEGGYRRFILHYAHLCAAAGGVAAFCIGSEMRGLTQLRDGPESFPAVAALRALAADVRAILGPETKIGYAADWSEYFGYHPNDGSGDVFYHLDPLWADPAIDFVGIDNYMPLSDWREGEDHADRAAGHGAIYDLDYLRANIAGGEGYDWYYASDDARAAQLRQPIEDGAYGEPWTFRYKDIRNWWGRFHWNRPGGVRAGSVTDWVPEMKPVWFTELGCPAVDKGTNQPNVFVDPASSENAVPYFSNGGQDRFIQSRYLLAMQSFWGDAANNPVSREYGGRMVDMSRAFVWAWDARPWPEFPARLEVWADGRNHALGHWISGRTHLVSLKDLVREACARAGVSAVAVEGLHGLVEGFHVEATETVRETLQPLMLAHGFDAFEAEGRIRFVTRTGMAARAIAPDNVAVTGDGAPRYELSRLPEAEMPARVRLGYVHPQRDFQTARVEAQMAGAEALFTAGSDLPVAMSGAEAAQIAARWLAETQVGRDRVSLALPRSDLDLGPGDVVALSLDDGAGRFRIDRVEETLSRRIEAVRVEPDVYRADPMIPELIVGRGPNIAGQAHVEVLDLPMLSGTEVPHAPWVAAAHVPWTGPMAVYAAAQDYDYRLDAEIPRGSVVGTTLTDLPAAAPERWAEQTLELQVSEAGLQARPPLDVLNGANVLALRAAGGIDWEVVQFREAELIGERIYRLRGLLRGQAGTEPLIAPVLPAGADMVLLDGSERQITLSPDHLWRERHLRVGPAERDYADARYRHLTVVPRGVGLRPYAPAHLAARRGASGAITLHWVRRTRTGGDAWEAAEVPLAEVQERYRVRVLLGGTPVREAEATAPEWSYSATAQAADGVAGPVTFAVAQISQIFGPGLETRIVFDD